LIGPFFIRGPSLKLSIAKISGRVKWARCVRLQLGELASGVAGHSVLQRLPAALELAERHATALAQVDTFEAEVVAAWSAQTVKPVDEGLRRPLLAFCPESGRVVANLDFRLMLLMREADCMAKMALPVPTIAAALHAKRAYFTTINDCLQV
jgi:dynein heavy chain, axonemal